jgi:hypothetical protein
MANAQKCKWCEAVLVLKPKDTNRRFCGAVCRDTFWNSTRTKNPNRGVWRRKKYGAVMAGFTMTPEQAAYVAGFWDGEGHIGVRRQARKWGDGGWTYSVGMEVSNTNTAVLNHVARLLQGNCYRTAAETHSTNPRAKPLYRLKLTTTEARAIIPILLPYLIVKKEAALLALEFWAAVDKLPLRMHEYQRALDVFWQRAKQLNKRGI